MTRSLIRKCFPSFSVLDTRRAAAAVAKQKARALLPLVAGAAVMLGAMHGAASANDTIRVGYGPFVSGGGLFIAMDKGYFDKVGITIDARKFDDGALAVPSMIAGELDVTNLPAAASLFNGVAKGAPITVFGDWGHNKPGYGFTAFNVSQKLYDDGVKKISDLARLKGKRIGVVALGSVNHYNAAQALLKAGLNPATDVQWVVNIAQPDLVKMLGQGQVDAVDVSYNLGVFAQQNKLGSIVASGDEIAPDFQIATLAARKDFIKTKRDVLVRFMMAYLKGVKEFNAAAKDPGKHPDVVTILTKYTTLNKPELAAAIAPHWAYVNEDGMPQVDSIMAMQDFWSGKYFQLVQKKVTKDQLFDLSIAKEAKERLDRENPSN